MKYPLGIMFLIMFSFNQVNAATITWNGSVDNDWHNDANWVGGAKPGMGDYAIINGAAFVVNISTTEGIQGVRVINATLNVTASGILNCSAATLPGIWAQGDINNMGTINFASISHAGIQLTNKTFTNNGTIAVDGTTQAGINITANATFHNNGNISINATTTHGLELGAATCTFNNNSGAILNIGNTGTIGARGIFNRGVFNNTIGSTLNIDNCTVNAGIENSIGSMFTNGGDLNIGTNIACAHMGIRNYTSFVNDGTVTIDMVNLHRIQNEDAATLTNTGTLSLSGGGGAVNMGVSTLGTGFFSNTGSIMGEGWINGASANFSNSGTTTPGFSTGTQTFTNGYLNNIYEVELASAIMNDLLVFNAGSSSDFVLAGTANVTLLGGYMPVIDQTFEIIDAPLGYTGTFATINYPTDASEWEVQYNASDVTLKYLGTILPIKLIKFETKVVGNAIKLEWSTASELNNSGFELHKSKDGMSWYRLEWIASKHSNSMGNQNYYYIDQKPQEGINYYRLNQIDVDGHLTQYPIVSAKYKIEQFNFNTYPNPIRNLMNINYDGSELLAIRVYNMKGKLMKSFQSNSAPLDMSALPSGQYWIEATAGVNKSTQMIIKK